MDCLGTDLHEYEQQTIVLRLNEDESLALLDILVEADIDPKLRRTPRPRERILLCDKLAHEMDAFKWRRR